MDFLNHNMRNISAITMKILGLLMLLNGQVFSSSYNFMVDKVESIDKDNLTESDVVQETTLMWTEKGIFGNVAIRGIQGDPHVWIKDGIKHYFLSQPLYEGTLQSSFRLALGFRYADQEIFFSDKTYREIYKLKFENSTTRPFKYNKNLEVLFSGTSPMVYGIAVDWIAGSVYWTDALYNWISVAPIDRKNLYKHVVVTGLDLPFGIAVDPLKGYLFWTDYGASSKIERSKLDGSERKVLVRNNLVKPFGITVDYQESRIYWVDDAKDTIETTDFEGQNRQTINLRDVTNRKVFMLFGIAVYQEYIFVADSINLEIRVYDKENMTFIKSVSTPSTRPYDLMMYDGSLQKPAPENPQMNCKTAGCQQICIGQGHGQIKCDCAVGYELKEDGKTCKSKMHKMPQFVYTLGNKLCATEPKVVTHPKLPLASQIYCFKHNLTNVQALAMHSHAQLLFYSDTGDKEIVRIRMDLDYQAYAEKEVLSVNTGKVRALAVDYVASNLYWADIEEKRIMISRIDGRYPTVLLENAGDVRGMDVDMTKNVMYWSSKKSIKRANLDGTNVEDFMTYKVYNPDGIVFDPVKNRLYWCNSWPKPNVTHINVNNRTYQLSVSSSSGSRSGWTFRDVAVYADYMAWTDGKGGVHFSQNKLEPGKTFRRTINHTDVDASHDIITYDTHLQPLPTNGSGCDDENGGCDHICIPKHNLTKACLCAVGFKLHTDGKKCNSMILKENFLLFADPYHRQIYQMDLKSTNMELQGLKIDNLEKPILVEYDQTKMLIYWVEKLASGNYLKRVSFDGEQETVLANFEQGLDIDSIALFDHKLYYAVSGNIKCINLSTNKVNIFYNEGDIFPNSVTMDRSKGTIYWAVKGSVKIYSSNLCAAPKHDRLATIDMNLNISGITTSGMPADKVIMWNSQTIWEVTLSTGKHTLILRNDSANFTSASFYDGSIYISQWNQKSMFKITNGKMEKIFKPLFSRIYGLKAYGSDANVKKNCQIVPPPVTITKATTTTTTISTTTTTVPTTTTTMTRKPTRTKKPRQTTTTGTTTVDHGNSVLGKSIGGNRPVEAASGLSSKNIYILAGASVAAFVIIAIIITVVFLTLRRQRKRKPATTVHYQADSHDNPTYMTHGEISDIPRATSQDLAPAASGVSFDPLPQKEGMDGNLTEAAIGPVVETNNVDTSDKAKLVQQEQSIINSSSVDLPDVRFSVDGNSNTVTASYTSNGEPNP